MGQVKLPRLWELIHMLQRLSLMQPKKAAKPNVSTKKYHYHNNNNNNNNNNKSFELIHKPRT